MRAVENSSESRPWRGSWWRSSWYSRGVQKVQEGVHMTHAKHIRFLFLFALLLALPFSAFAQSSNGSISGNTADESGPLPGVTVTVVNAATAATRTVVSNGTGHYEIALLTP